MEQFESQLFIFSMIAALVTVFVLVYTLMKKILGADININEENEDEEYIPQKRGPVRRIPENKPILLNKPSGENDGNV